jgi:hypothetical protein
LRTRSLLLAVLPALALGAQAPPGWNRCEPLGAGLAQDATWFGAGLWGAEKNGPAATLVDSQGMGNAYTGAGAFAEAGLNAGSWSFALKGYADKDALGRSHFTVMNSHALWTKDGWTAGWDQEPLVWGYGLLGGYLLGEADRPVPKVRIETPYAWLHLGSWSLGEWGLQWFTGRLENARPVPEDSQMPLSIARDQAQVRDPQAPFFSGYRIQSRSRDGKVEFYLNWTVLWGGTVNGVPMTQGYGLGDYLTAITGTKDVFATSSGDYSDPNHPPEEYVNNARSSTNFDIGMRFQADWLAHMTGSDKAWVYVSRGSKGILTQYKVLYHQPGVYLQKEVENNLHDADNLNLSGIWNRKDSYVVPNLIVPNDTIGILLQWPGVRFGLEHHDTTNPEGVSYRSFVNSIYTGGFYHYGDPVGEAMGGEANTSDAKLELDLGPRVSLNSWVLAGIRPFRDDPGLWDAAHPGLKPCQDNFKGLQQEVAWRMTPVASLRAGASWMNHSAVSWVPDNSGNGFRWYAELAFRWSRSRTGTP